MLATSACHQNKSNLDAIRQYAKRRTTTQLPPSLLFYKYYLICSENYITSRVLSRGCHLMAQCQKHVNMAWSKI